MKNTLRLSVLGTFILIGTISFGQSLNISGGYSNSSIRMGGLMDYESSETKNGINYSSNSMSENKNLHGFNVGIGYEFQLIERLSLEAGLRYQTRGYHWIYEYSYEYSHETNPESYSETNDFKYKMKYLDLPLVLNVTVLTGDFNIYMRTGIYAGFLTETKYTAQGEYRYSDGSNGSYEFTERLSENDFGDRFAGGFVFGVGTEYKGFYFETNCNFGSYSLANLDDKTYSSELSFSLGYKIKFKKKAKD